MFFVSASDEPEPEFRARDLKQSVKQGKAVVGKIVARSRAAGSPQTSEPVVDGRTDMEARYWADLPMRERVSRSSTTDRVETGDAVRVCPS